MVGHCLHNSTQDNPAPIHASQSVLPTGKAHAIINELGEGYLEHIQLWCLVCIA